MLLLKQHLFCIKIGNIHHTFIERNFVKKGGLMVYEIGNAT